MLRGEAEFVEEGLAQGGADLLGRGSKRVGGAPQRSAPTPGVHAYLHQEGSSLLDFYEEQGFFKIDDDKQSSKAAQLLRKTMNENNHMRRIISHGARDKARLEARLKRLAGDYDTATRMLLTVPGMSVPSTLTPPKYYADGASEQCGTDTDVPSGDSSSQLLAALQDIQNVLDVNLDEGQQLMQRHKEEVLRAANAELNEEVMSANQAAASAAAERFESLLAAVVDEGQDVGLLGSLTENLLRLEADNEQLHEQLRVETSIGRELQPQLNSMLREISGTLKQVAAAAGLGESPDAPSFAKSDSSSHRGESAHVLQMANRRIVEDAAREFRFDGVLHDLELFCW